MINPGDVTVGTCGNCGGPVTMPGVWHCILPPQKTCSVCGAIAAEYGSVIPMQTAPTTGRIPNVWITDVTS